MRWILALVLMAGAARAEMTEVQVSIPSQGKAMVGTLALPEGAPAPVVLLFHGFTGTRDEMAIPGTVDGVFSRTARLLAEAGYASLRVDFIGSGDSDGDFADTTFEGQVADELAALAFAQGDGRVQGDALRIIGWSQGGLVATAVAGRSDAPKAVALWAAVADPMATFSGLLGADAVAAGMTTGDTPVKITLPWGAEIGLKQGYFDGLTTFRPLDEIASYTGPLFVAQGTLDTVVLPVAQEMLLAAHDGEDVALPARWITGSTYLRHPPHWTRWLPRRLCSSTRVRVCGRWADCPSYGAWRRGSGVHPRDGSCVQCLYRARNAGRDGCGDDCGFQGGLGFVVDGQIAHPTGHGGEEVAFTREMDHAFNASALWLEKAAFHGCAAFDDDGCRRHIRLDQCAGAQGEAVGGDLAVKAALYLDRFGLDRSGDAAFLTDDQAVGGDVAVNLSQNLDEAG
jgi:uncharacterized protein